MKNIFIKCLPLVAATLLITACSKDDTIDSNNPIPTDNTIDKDSYVTVPLSVKVDENVCQSKMAISTTDGNIGKVVTRKFEPEDEGIISLQVTGNGIITADLPLKSTTLGDREIYYFEGDIKVENDKLQDFKDGNITLTGSFSTPAMETPEKTKSTVSLIDLVNHCPHEFKGSFRSNAGSIVLIDQLSYLAIKWKDPNNKYLDITIDDNYNSFQLNDNGEIWIALEGSRRINIETFGIEAKVAEVGHIYNINKVMPESVKSAEEVHEMKVGEKWTPTFIFTPADCNVTIMKNWHFKNNDAVGFVNDNNVDGTVYAYHTGSATLVASTINGIEATYIIKVTQ
ncbi:MAG: hypothetical protein PUC50_04415 [Bacteroidales bacterium]|nr:hypothetical protein [Bacteroidales bacterium]